MPLLSVPFAPVLGFAIEPGLTPFVPARPVPPCPPAPPDPNQLALPPLPLGANITLAELPEPELRQLFPHEELQIPVSCGGLGAGAGGRMDMRAVGLVPVRRASRYCTGFFVLIHSYLTLMGRGARLRLSR